MASGVMAALKRYLELRERAGAKASEPPPHSHRGYWLWPLIDRTLAAVTHESAAV